VSHDFQAIFWTSAKPSVRVSHKDLRQQVSALRSNVVWELECALSNIFKKFLLVSVL
jgi:hypothetical protein